MQTGGLIDGDVKVFHDRVLVNGIQRPIVSWSDDRELSSNLPAQVIAGSGITQATGSVEWATDAEVSVTSPSPWSASGGWLPKSGDRVEVYSGDGFNEYRVFTGVIDETSGSAGEGFQSTLIDDFDRLSTPFSHVPLLRIMPPLVEGEARRGIGLSYLFLVDAALRSSGFFATPPTEPRCAVSAPLQTSAWAEVGLVSSGRVTAESWATRHVAPWGVAMGNIRNDYLPALANPMTERVQITGMVAPEHAGAAILTAQYGARHISVGIYTGRTVRARLDGVMVCELPMGEGTIFTLLVKDGGWTLKNDLGATSTGMGAASNDTLTGFTIQADSDSRIAGVQISHPNSASEFQSLNYRRTANYRLQSFAFMAVLNATPTVISTVEELLSEISEATLSAMWIDEHGIFQWATPNAIAGSPAVQALTALSDITKLSWSDSLLASRSKVSVSYDVQAVTSSRYRNVLLRELSSTTMESEEVNEDFLTPEAGEEWIMPDTSITVLKSGNWSPYNLRRGTFGGGIFTSSGETISDAGLTFTVKLESVDLRTLKLTHKVGTIPADVQFETVTSPTDAALWPRLRDRPLPVLRGFGRVRSVEKKLPAVETGGPGPALEHGLGVWSTQGDDSIVVVERFRDYLVAGLAKPLAVITGLEVFYDPRRQLGDVITVISESLLGISLQCVIVGMSRAAGTTRNQSLSVRIIEASSLYATYREWNDAGGEALTYLQWNALDPKTQTYAQFNQN